MAEQNFETAEEAIAFIRKQLEVTDVTETPAPRGCGGACQSCKCKKQPEPETEE